MFHSVTKRADASSGSAISSAVRKTCFAPLYSSPEFRFSVTECADERLPEPVMSYGYGCYHSSLSLNWAVNTVFFLYLKKFSLSISLFCLYRATLH
jgi:hypothetical protein